MQFLTRFGGRWVSGVVVACFSETSSRRQINDQLHLITFVSFGKESVANFEETLWQHLSLLPSFLPSVLHLFPFFLHSFYSWAPGGESSEVFPLDFGNILINVLIVLVLTINAMKLSKWPSKLKTYENMVAGQNISRQNISDKIYRTKYI